MESAIVTPKYLSPAKLIFEISYDYSNFKNEYPSSDPSTDLYISSIIYEKDGTPYTTEWLGISNVYITATDGAVDVKATNLDIGYGITSKYFYPNTEYTYSFKTTSISLQSPTIDTGSVSFQISSPESDVQLFAAEKFDIFSLEDFSNFSATDSTATKLVLRSGTKTILYGGNFTNQKNISIDSFELLDNGESKFVMFGSWAAKDFNFKKNNIEKIINSLLKGNDYLSGSDFDDTFFGGRGNDVIDGNDGNDLIYCDLGNDLLTGGGGEDIFYFNAKLKKENLDTITDFASGIDSIIISAGIAKKLKGVLDFSNNFYIKNDLTAQDKDDYLVYDHDSGILFYDANASGNGKSFAVVTIGSGTDIEWDDIFVI